MHSVSRPSTWKILLAFGIIYFVWGSTFLAIRVGVQEVPPFLLAAARFTLAGAILYGWMRVRGAPSPSAREWSGACFLGAMIFLIDYGCLFWAEQRVPSGVAAVVLATIPVFMTLFEIILLRTQRLTFRLGLGLLLGIVGVAVLMNRSGRLSEAPLDKAGAAALLVAAFTWSAASILTRRIALPTSKPMSAAAQMLCGGVQLFVAAAITGEFRGFHVQSASWNAWFSLLYLIAAGSIAGFTAYVWLLHYRSPTQVGTYAYVNPVVAVALGYMIGGESIGSRTLFGTVLILVSVIIVTTAKSSPVLLQANSPERAEGIPGLPIADAD